MTRKDFNGLNDWLTDQERESHALEMLAVMLVVAMIALSMAMVWSAELVEKLVVVGLFLGLL